MMMVGLYFVRLRGEVGFCLGQIARQVAPDAYLLRFERAICPGCGSPEHDGAPPLPLEMFMTADLSEIDEDSNEQAFKFFDSEAERQTWLDWAPTHSSEEGEPAAAPKTH